MKNDKKRAVNIRDVAKAANVSSATVSLVINHSEAPSMETRERVMRAVRKLNYQPDPAFRAAFQKRSSGTNKRTRTLGFLTSGEIFENAQRDDGYYSKVHAGIQREIETHRYHLMCKCAKTDGVALPDIVTEGLVDGLLIEGNFPKPLLELLVERLPVCFIDQVYPDLEASSVMPNVERGVHDVLSYLWDLDHRDIIAFVPAQRTGQVDRYQRAVRQFFVDRNIQLPQLSERQDINPENHDQVMKEYARKIFDSPRRPTALISWDIYARGIMEALQDLGLRVPEDISIVGRDDTLAARTASPQLTSYSFRMDEMGRLATDLLIQKIENRDRPICQMSVNGQIVERASCVKNQVIDRSF